MNFTYIFYLLLLTPLLAFSLYVSKERVLKDEPTFLEYSVGTLVVLIFWGELAMYLNQWHFPRNVNLGIYIGNHPIETIILGIILPLFVVSMWEFIKRLK